MHKFLLSIIIPIYKVEPYIVRCIDTLLYQTYRNIEVILVDDCSPDRSMEIAIEYIKQSPLSKDIHFVYLKHKYNRGLSAARNTGIDAAKGDYVFFMDSDDKLYDERSIEYFVREIEIHHSPDVICGSFEVIKDIEKKQNFKVASFLDSRHSIISFYTSGKTYMMAWNKMVRLDFIKEYQLYFMEGLIHEDDLWSYLLANKAQSFCQIDAITYCYYINSNTIMTATNPWIHNKHRMIILNEIDKYYKNGYIVNCKDNRIFMAKQKVHFWSLALRTGISKKELLNMLCVILKSMANRLLFIREFLLYYALAFCRRVRSKLDSLFSNSNKS